MHMLQWKTAEEEGKREVEEWAARRRPKRGTARREAARRRSDWLGLDSPLGQNYTITSRNSTGQWLLFEGVTL